MCRAHGRTHFPYITNNIWYFKKDVPFFRVYLVVGFFLALRNNWCLFENILRYNISCVCFFSSSSSSSYTAAAACSLSLHIWWALKLSIVRRTVSVAAASAAAALCFALPCYLISFGYSVAEPCVLFFLFPIRVFPFGSSFSICHFRAWLGKAEGKNQLSGLITWNILFYFHKFGAAYLCVCMFSFSSFCICLMCVCFFLFHSPLALGKTN